MSYPPRRALRQGSSASGRRSRLAFLVAQRQVVVLDRPTLLLRVIALTVVATFVSLTPQPVAVLLLLPAGGIAILRYRVPDRVGAARSGTRWWQFEGWADALSGQLTVFTAAWMTQSLPINARLGAVGAAALLVSVIFLQLCLSPRWYRPDEPIVAVIEFLRHAAGPIAVLISAAIALPANWPPGTRVLVLLLVALPLAATALTRDQDLTVVHVVLLIEQEAQEGRQVVLDATHGALSTNLRLLEQQAREHRSRSPRLYELAVSANCRLRETLTLADPARETASGPESLSAVVNTLALAVGARGQYATSLQRLADDDRDLARLAISDLVGAALTAGAAEVMVEVGLDRRGRVQVSVRDDAVTLPATDPLGPLRRRFGQLAGEVEGPLRTDSSRLTRAHWPASPGTSRF